MEECMIFDVIKKDCGCKSKVDCPCTKDCVRHGDCAACREHHSNLTSDVSCER